MHTNGRAPNDSRVWRGLAAGIAGGVAGAYLMNQVHGVWSAVAERLDSTGSSDDARPPDADEPATTKAAEAVSEGVAGHQLSDTEKAVASPLVHYGFGAAMGGVYGALVEWRREAAALGGVPFGTALWLLADEVGVPAAGLSAAPWDAPLPSHARGLLAHLVYGLTVEGVRRGLRAVV